MEHLNNLTSILNKINDVSIKIITDALPIMKVLNSDDNYLMEDLKEEITDIDEEEALECMKEITCEFVKDAETVQNEIHQFSLNIISGEAKIFEEERMYPFFLQVWYGDMYGNQGIAGLHSLYNDLKSQSININEDFLVNSAIERLV